MALRREKFVRMMLNAAFSERPYLFVANLPPRLLERVRYVYKMYCNFFCFVDFKKEVLCFMAKVDEKMKTLSGDVEHMHYLLNRVSTKECVVPSEDFQNARMSDHIPCHDYTELKHLNRQLEDRGFFKHCVSIAIKFNSYFYKTYLIDICFSG